MPEAKMQPNITKALEQIPQLKQIICPQKEDFIKPETLHEFAEAFKLLNIQNWDLPQVEVIFVEEEDEKTGETQVKNNEVKVIYDKKFITEDENDENSLLNRLKRERGYPGIEQTFKHELAHVAMWSVIEEEQQPAIRLLDEGWASLLEHSSRSDIKSVDNLIQDTKEEIKKDITPELLDRCLDFDKPVSQYNHEDLNASEYSVGRALLLWIRENYGGNEAMIALLKNSPDPMKRNDDELELNNKFPKESIQGLGEEESSRVAMAWEREQFQKALLSITGLSSLEEVKAKFIEWLGNPEQNKSNEPENAEIDFEIERTALLALAQQITSQNPEIPANELEVVEEYYQLLTDIVPNIDFEEDISEELIKNLCKKISAMDGNKDDEIIEGDVKLSQARDWAYTPDLIKKWNTVNCSGATAMLTAILRKFGAEAYFANPMGHAAVVVKDSNDKYWYADPRNNLVESLDDCLVADNADSRIMLFKAKKPLPYSHYQLIPAYKSLQDAVSHTISENNEELEKQAQDNKTPALLAKRELGEELNKGLNLPQVEEKLLLEKTSEWQEEELNLNAFSDMGRGGQEFANIFLENGVDFSNFRQVVKENSELFIKIMSSSPQELQESDTLLELENVLPDDINIELFEKAHNEYWQCVEGLRNRSKGEFKDEVEKLIREIK